MFRRIAVRRGMASVVVFSGVAALVAQQGSSPVLPALPADPAAPRASSMTFRSPGLGLLRVTAATSDPRGNVYLTGTTSVRALPGTDRAFQTAPNGQDGFVMKLDAQGRVLWCSYFGGNDRRSLSRHFPGDHPLAIAVDSQEQVHIGGYTSSTDLPALNPFLASPQVPLGADGFVATFSADGSRLLFASYLGGPDESSAVTGIAAGPAGERWLLATSASRRIATTSDLSDGSGQNIVVKLSPSGSVVWSTRLPGPLATAFTVDAGGDAYVATPDAEGAVLTRLDASGRRIVYQATVRSDVRVTDLAVTLDQELVAVGRTFGRLETVDAWQASPGGEWDAFVARLTREGRVSTTSYLGGPDWDASDGQIRVTPADAGVVVAFNTESKDLLVVRPWVARHVDGSLRSVDLGNTWTYTSGPNGDLVTDGVHATLFAPAGSHLLVSTDAGDTWSREDPPPTRPDGNRFEPVQVSIVAVAPGGPRYVSSRYIVWRYAPGGSETTEILRARPGAVLNVLVVNPHDGSVWVGGNYGVDASWDGGQTWVARRTGLPPPFHDDGDAGKTMSPDAIVFDPVQPERVYLGMDTGLYFSDNAGASWRNLTADAPALAGAMGDVNAIAIDPGDRRTIYVGTSSRGLLVSRDRGANWTVAFPDHGIASVAVDPVDSRVYAGVGLAEGDPLIWQSVDRGSTWRPCSLPWQMRRAPKRLVVHRASRRVFALASYFGSVPFLTQLTTPAGFNVGGLAGRVGGWLAEPNAGQDVTLSPAFASYLTGGSVVDLTTVPGGEVVAILQVNDGFAQGPAEFAVVRFVP